MIISKHRISVHRLDVSYIDIKELLDMHKKVYVFLLVCLLLAGCSSDKTKPSVENEKNLIIDINKIQLPVGQDCSLGSYYVDGDVVYYSVYMSLGDYEENPDAELMFLWKQKSGLLISHRMSKKWCISMMQFIRWT